MFLRPIANQSISMCLGAVRNKSFIIIEITCKFNVFVLTDVFSTVLNAANLSCAPEFNVGATISIISNS